MEITPNVLNELLRYEPETGKLYWRRRRVKWFKDGGHTATHSCNAWNSKNASKEALTANGHGYLAGKVLGEDMRAHRVIWAMVYGEWPQDQIDHINGVRDDNRIENLRSVTLTENSMNTKVRKDSVLGIRGVQIHKQTGRWRARITVNKKKIHLGLFDRIEDAISARRNADLKYGFHENHGRT